MEFRQVSDLYNSNRVIPFQTWIKRGVQNRDYIIWRGIIHCISKNPNLIENYNIDKGHVHVDNLYKDIDDVTQKILRRSFDQKDTLNIIKHSKAKQKFNIIFGNIDEKEWKKALLLTKNIYIYAIMSKNYNLKFYIDI